MWYESMQTEYTSPSYKAESYHCPHCGVYAKQDWYEVFVQNSPMDESEEDMALSYCSNCSNYCVWVKGEMVYPNGSTAPLPLQDTPEDVLEDYYQAREVLSYSTKAASALLRLALQKLISYLGREGDNLEDSLTNLKRKGLDAKIQSALESVKMTGVEAIPPGVLDKDDDKDTAMVLFNIINLIVDSMITQPRKVDELMDQLPGKKKKHKDYVFRAKIG